MAKYNKQEGGVNDFYDEMFERLEEAADRVVLARWRAACPKIADTLLEGMWLHLVKKEGRAGARQTLDGWLDTHDSDRSSGGPGLFDASGEVIDEEER
jgi:hypothetical protein